MWERMERWRAEHEDAYPERHARDEIEAGWLKRTYSHLSRVELDAEICRQQRAEQATQAEHVWSHVTRNLGT